MKKIVLYTLLSAFLLTSCDKPKAEEAKNDSPRNEFIDKGLSLQLYSLRDTIKTNYTETLKAVADMGFTSIEAANYKDGKFYDRTPEEFKADLEAVGLTALSSHTTKELSAEELKSGDFKASLAWWNTCLDASKAAGMSYVVIPWMDVPSTLKNLETYCKYYNAIGELAASKGIKLGYHNHAHEFQKIENEVMYDYMLQNTNPEYLFFQMDVYWVVRGGQSPVEYFEKYPNRFKLLHLKDHKELGQSGMVGFDAILEPNTLKKAGVENLVVEVEKYNFGPIKSVQLSFDYLQKFK